ncbi:MAG: hypothetical protein JNG88_17460 [Phycisphaerales bacterium]|nr:hypothetical protein [Phycisphaerales bacterium]
MSRISHKFRRLALPVLATPLLSGCVLLSDAINPTLLTQVGLDPNTIFPSPGAVIVVFNNQTQFPVLFYAFQAQEPADLAVDATNMSLLVDPATTRNTVLDCPIGVVSPGVLGPTFEPETLAATVFNGQGTDVDYLGAALISGRDFACGDVIEIRVTAGAGGDQQQAFAINVFVLPGT